MHGRFHFGNRFLDLEIAVPMKFRFPFAQTPLRSRRRTVGASGHLARGMGVEQLERRWLLAADTDDQISEAIEASIDTKREVGNSVPGAIASADDVDLYRVYLWTGMTIDFDIDTVDNGPGGLDSYLRLFDSGGNLLAVNNNAANVDEYHNGYDAYIRYSFPASGTYFLGVSNANNTNYNPVTGEGDRLIGSAVGDYTLVLRTAGDWPDVGDVLTKAEVYYYTQTGANVTLRGRIEHDTDVDLYQIPVSKGTFDFDVDTFAGEAGGLNPYMRLFAYNGQEITRGTPGIAPGDAEVRNDPYLRYNFEQGGTLYVGISNANHTKYKIDGRTGATPTSATAAGYYTLRIYRVPDDYDDDTYLLASVGPVTTAPIVIERIIEVDLDVDLYKFSVAQGQTVDFDIDTPFNGLGSVDSYLRLFDSTQQLAANDGAAAPGEKTPGFDAYLRYTFEKAGLYFIAVSNKNNIQFDHQTGQGDTAGGLHSAGEYKLSITQIVTNSTDLDDTISEALFHGTKDELVGWNVTGVIHQDVDVDMYYFDVAEAGQTGYITVYHDPNKGFQIRLFDPLGQQLDYSSGNPFSTSNNILRHRFEKAGRYFVGVSARNNVTYDPITGIGDTSGPPMDVGPYILAVAFLPIDTDDEVREATPFPELTNDVSRQYSSLDVDVDVNLYRIDALAGQVVDIDVDTDRNGYELNSYLRLFTADGVELASNDDGLSTEDLWPYPPQENTDSYIRYTFQTSGAYYIGVSNTYNRTYNIVDGSSDTAGGAKVRGSYHVDVRSVSLVNNDPDDALSESASLQAVTRSPQTIDSVIDRNSDVDMFRFTVTAGQKVNFDIDTRLTSLFSYLRLFSASGAELASNRTTPAPGETLSGFDAFLQYTFATGGTYYLGVSTYYNTTYDPITGADTLSPYGYSAGEYTLIVQTDGPPAVPALTFDLDTTSIFEINGVATGTVTRVDSSLADALIVNIAATNNNSVKIPAAIAIPAGQASINFSIIAIHDTTQGTRYASLTLNAAGMAPISKVVNVVDSDGPGHNGNLPHDTNADGRVTAMDALLVINYLNVTGGGPVPSASAPYLDVSADGQITPMDALLVINRLNSQASGEGEPRLEVAPIDQIFAGCGYVQDLFFCPAWFEAWPSIERTQAREYERAT